MSHDFDIAELIADNQLLLNRVDDLFNGEESAGVRRSRDDINQVESLTDSLIDGLYKQIKKQDKAGDEQSKSKISSKKQVLAYQKPSGTQSKIQSSKTKTTSKKRLVSRDRESKFFDQNLESSFADISRQARAFD